MKKNIRIVGLTLWVIAAIFYSYELVLRIAPSVMVEDLMGAFKIDAAYAGTIVASYLYIYAPMQLVAGLLLDRYNVRTLMTIAAVAVGGGSILFGFAPSTSLAVFGRVLMGFGSSFAFITMLYISSTWFTQRLYPIFVGVGNSLGMIGAVWAQGPLSHLVEDYGWRQLSITLGLIGLVYGVVIFAVCTVFYSRIKEKRIGNKVKVNLLEGLSIVLRKSQSWIIASVSFLMFATTSAFAGLWGVTFIKKAHGYPEATAGFAVSMIFIGWIFGGPTLGYLKVKVFQIRTILMFSSLLALIAITLTIYITELPTALTFSLLFAVGFFSSSMLLAFNYTTLLNIPELSGVALGFTSLTAMLGGSILEPVVGYLLDLHSGGSTRLIRGALEFSLSDYHFALACFPLCFALAFLATLFLKNDSQVKAIRSLPSPHLIHTHRDKEHFSLQ